VDWDRGFALVLFVPVLLLFRWAWRRWWAWMHPDWERYQELRRHWDTVDSEHKAKWEERRKRRFEQADRQ
jgi:hypothetical protein